MKTILLFSDLETFSPVPIKCGTHAYAEQAEVMLWTYAFDDGPVQCWDATTGEPAPADLLAAIQDPAVMTVWHNGGNFDATVLRHALPDMLPPISRIHDTMAQALAHGLPGALGTLCDVLGVPADQVKDPRGNRLIDLFCKPRPSNHKLRRATRLTHPTEWQEFIEYAIADIEAMRAIYKRMPVWNYRGAERALWELDHTINNRGVCMDLDLAQAALRATDRAKDSLARQAREMTGGQVAAATQRDRMLEYILAEHDLRLADLTGSTVDKLLDAADTPPALRALLEVRAEASKASAAKYKKVLQGASADGRLRGLLQFCGASRTGRWAGRLFQPQNLYRGTIKGDELERGIAAIKADCEDLIFDEVMELAASALRGLIVAPAGKKLVVADLSNIEGRMLAWLAGETWKIDAFADFDMGNGHDLYALAYAKAFGITPEEVMQNKKTGDGSMRQIGKVMELALGYEGGVGAFITFSLAYGIDLDAMAEKAIDKIPPRVLSRAEEAYTWAEKNRRTYGLSRQAYVVCDSFKRMWRDAHPNIAEWWKELGQAARRAILSPGVTVPCRQVKMRRDGAWLRIVLPSGRALCYPAPTIDAENRLTYMGVNQYSRKWSRLHTYGGKLAENITQAASRDVLAHAMPAIESAGYQIVLTVHDEIIAEAPDHQGYTHEHLARLMATVPPWAPELPLAAAGFEASRYRKD